MSDLKEKTANTISDLMARDLVRIPEDDLRRVLDLGERVQNLDDATDQQIIALGGAIHELAIKALELIGCKETGVTYTAFGANMALAAHQAIHGARCPNGCETG